MMNFKRLLKIIFGMSGILILSLPLTARAQSPVYYSVFNHTGTAVVLVELVDKACAHQTIPKKKVIQPRFEPLLPMSFLPKIPSDPHDDCYNFPASVIYHYEVGNGGEFGKGKFEVLAKAKDGTFDKIQMIDKSGPATVKIIGNTLEIFLNSKKVSH